MARRDHHGAVAGCLGEHAAHEHGRRGSQAAVQHSKAHLIQGTAHRRLQRRTRKAGVPPHRDSAVRGRFAYRIRQPEAETVGDIFRGAHRQIHFFSEQVRCDASYVAAVLQFTVILHAGSPPLLPCSLNLPRRCSARKPKPSLSRVSRRTRRPGLPAIPP